MSQGENGRRGSAWRQSLALPRQEKASSSRAAGDMSSSAGDRGNTFAKEDTISDSDMDLDELIMIDQGLT